MKWQDQIPFDQSHLLLSFKPAFLFSSFAFIKRLFSSASVSAIRVVSSAYLRLLIFLLGILIPVCDSSSLAFHMMYSAYKLNKQRDNIQPWHTPFPIWNESVVPCPVLTVASWPVYGFLTRQVRWSGIPISLRISHNLLWSTQSKALTLVSTNFFCNKMKPVDYIITHSFTHSHTYAPSHMHTTFFGLYWDY